MDYLLSVNFKAGSRTLGFLEANSRGPEAGKERNGSARAVQAGSYYHTERRKQEREGKNGERLLRRPDELSERPAMLSDAPSLRQNPGAVFLALGQSRLA